MSRKDASLEKLGSMLSNSLTADILLEIHLRQSTRIIEKVSFKAAGTTGHPRIAFVEQVLEKIAEQLNTSTRAIAKQMNAAQQCDGYMSSYCTHTTFKQSLGQLDYQSRVDFCLQFCSVQQFARVLVRLSYSPISPVSRRTANSTVATTTYGMLKILTQHG